MKTEQKKEESSGVEELIERLKEQGIAAGQEKAEQIVADAQKRADRIIEEAEREAQQIFSHARAEVELIRTAGEEAIKLAARNAILTLRDHLLGSFSHEVIRVVNKQMVTEEFLQQLIIELAGRVRKETGLDANQKVVFQLPETIDGMDDLSRNPEKLKEDALSRFTAAMAANLLRSGVEIEISGDQCSGLVIKLADDHVVVDFSGEAVGALLLEHLQPRFRAILQGIVK